MLPSPGLCWDGSCSHGWKIRVGSVKNGPAVCVQELTDAAELCLCDQFGNDQTDSENHPRVIGIPGIH